MDRIEDILFAFPVPWVTCYQLALEDQTNLLDAGHDGQVPMSVFYGDGIAVGVEPNERE
jgi:hypothetical protein